MRGTRGADVARRRRFREGGRPGAQPRARGRIPPLPRCACALAEQAGHAPPPRGALLDLGGGPPRGGVAWGRPRLSPRGQRPSGSAQVHTPPPHSHHHKPQRLPRRSRTSTTREDRPRGAAVGVPAPPGAAGTELGNPESTPPSPPSRPGGELTQARTPALAGMPTRGSSPLATHMSCAQDKVKVLLG